VKSPRAVQSTATPAKSRPDRLSVQNRGCAKSFAATQVCVNEEAQQQNSGANALTLLFPLLVVEPVTEFASLTTTTMAPSPPKPPPADLVIFFCHFVI
jgi:hypothetical protein